jgi:glucokinase
MGSVLGIDVGGTNVKFGVVNEKGELSDKIKYPTADLISQGEFIVEFSNALSEQLELHKDVGINKVGIGCPGLISKDRTTTLKLQNIPQLNGINIIEFLSKKHPEIDFKLENDAKVAALGEHHFAKEKINSFLMITLGTGVGGAAVIDGELFTGANGNGIEIGHMVSSSGDILEHHIGKKGMVRQALKYLKKNKDVASKLHSIPAEELTAKHIEKAAKKGDEIAQKVLKKVGKYLGQTIVSSLRVLDVDTIVIGGGIAEVFHIMEESMWTEIKKYLGDYYTETLNVKVAELENEAGIIGAASLCF